MTRWKPFSSAVVLLLMSACSDEPQFEAGSRSPQHRWVAITAGDESAPIKGKVACEDALSSPCIPEAGRITEALLACGVERVTIDVSSSHLITAYFDNRKPERATVWPTELKIVGCVRDRVGFPFNANIVASPNELAEPDPTPFESLHA